jgi:hypothetical protein
MEDRWVWLRDVPGAAIEMLDLDEDEELDDEEWDEEDDWGDEDEEDEEEWDEEDEEDWDEWEEDDDMTGFREERFANN